MRNKIKFEAEFTDDQFEVFIIDSILKNTNKNAKTSILLSDYNQVVDNVINKLIINSKNNYIFSIIDKEYSSCEFNNRYFYKSLDLFLNSTIELDLVICITNNSKEIKEFYFEAQKFTQLHKIPFIYKIKGSETYPMLNEFDQLKENGTLGTHVFITNQFDDGLFEEIYRYSLTRVKKKCQVRDAYDLFQCLEKCSTINGDIVEFGSFEGHSGLIMAEFIQRKKLKKKLFLFDTFEKFPSVDLGIDTQWNNLDVKKFDFNHVKNIFRKYDFVNLVKGKFNETLHELKTDHISLAYVDCDSYEATKLVANSVFKKITLGGCILFEDYGHHTLLGARIAVDEFIKENSETVFSFFSFFSGLKIVVKLK